jgi:tRNA G37 N-methylase TrmD
LTLHLVAEAQKRGGVAAFIDAEHALDTAYAKSIGVKLDDLLVSQPDTGEQALEIVDMLVKSNAVDVIVIDSVVRLLPGVVGASESLSEESFEQGLLEYPHYTRPQLWEGREIPETLMSGHHRKIRDWRLAQSLELTKTRRPDLWDAWQRRNGAATAKH